MLRKLRSAMQMIVSNGFDKPTGLELVSTRDLVDLVKTKEAFSQNLVPGTSLLWAPWNQMMNVSFFEWREMDSFRSSIRALLKDKPILELGVGNNFILHRHISMNVFGVSQYSACDKQTRFFEGQEGFFKEDLLIHLEEHFVPGQSVMSFGVLNEPLDIQHEFWFSANSVAEAEAGHVEYEYIKRLMDAFQKVVASGGIIMGDGIHPLGRNYMLKELARRGVHMNYELFETLADGYKEVPESKRPRIVDPFFLMAKV
jgi:hypothetical protein